MQVSRRPNIIVDPSGIPVSKYKYSELLEVLKMTNVFNAKITETFLRIKAIRKHGTQAVAWVFTPLPT